MAQDTNAAVQEAGERFYHALNAMFTGDLGPMAEIWSHANDVVYMGPDGEIHTGWAATLAYWEVQADMKLGGRVTSSEQHFVVGEDLAVMWCRENGSNTGPDGHHIEVSLRATNVFRKEGGAWKMIGHHTDRMSFT